MSLQVLTLVLCLAPAAVGSALIAQLAPLAGHSAPVVQQAAVCPPLQPHPHDNELSLARAGEGKTENTEASHVIPQLRYLLPQLAVPLHGLHIAGLLQPEVLGLRGNKERREREGELERAANTNPYVGNHVFVGLMLLPGLYSKVLLWANK